MCRLNLPLAAPLLALRISLLSELQQVGEQGASWPPVAQPGASDGRYSELRRAPPLALRPGAQRRRGGVFVQRLGLNSQ